MEYVRQAVCFFHSYHIFVFILHYVTFMRNKCELKCHCIYYPCLSNTALSSTTLPSTALPSTTLPSTTLPSTAPLMFSVYFDRSPSQLVILCINLALLYSSRLFNTLLFTHYNLPSNFSKYLTLSLYELFSSILINSNNDVI